MIVYNRENKKLVIPNALGNFGNAGGGSGSGLTPEEAAEIASAVTEAAIEEYDTEIQVDLEDIRENLSATTEDLAALSAYTATISGKSYDNEIEALSGSVNDIRSDVGTLSGATSGILSDIEALSGITESVSGAVDTLSGITTANTENIATLSAATEAISGSLGNYATTADTNELATAISGVSESLANYATTATTDALSAVTSALTENLETLSAVTSGLVSAQDIVYDYAVISTYTVAQKQALWNEISGYKNTNKKVWIRHQLGTEVRWYLCYKFDVPYIYFVANDNRKIYYLMFNQTGSFSNSEYVIQSAISAGSGVSISNNVVSLNIGEGLAFSGNTLVVSGISGGGNVFVIYDIWAQNTQLADFLFQYANNGSISSGFPEDTRILLWLGQDFQGAFDSHSQGFVELYPSELKDVEGTDVFFLGGVYATSDTDAYAVRVGYTEQGYPSNNWIERVRQDIAVYKPAFVRFGNDERGYLIYDADNDRFEYNNGYVATGDTTTVCPDLIDKLFTNYIFDGGDIWTGSEYLYPLNTNKFYVKQNGETTTYAAPRIKRKQLASTVTIDGVNFDWEITYDYGDWILTAYYAGNEGNDAANLRITSA